LQYASFHIANKLSMHTQAQETTWREGWSPNNFFGQKSFRTWKKNLYRT